MSQQQRPAVFDLVAEDVRTGLSKYFEVGDVRFVAPTDSDQPLSNDGHDAVAWECDCVDAKVFPDLEPSQQSFVADGITIVSKATGGTAPTSAATSTGTGSSDNSARTCIAAARRIPTCSGCASTKTSSGSGIPLSERARATARAVGRHEPRWWRRSPSRRRRRDRRRVTRAPRRCRTGHRRG